VSALVIFFLTQVAGYGALRQKLDDLKEVMIDEKLQRQKLEERVHELEVAPLSMAKKAGQ
jgi:hypothetical protein